MFFQPILKTMLCLSLACAGSASAQVLSAADCNEGGDFIHNAALSRDYGIKGENFVDTLEGDLQRIRDMPPPARWFAYSQVEEDLLRNATHGVFLLPRSAALHRDDFITRCNKLRISVAYIESKRDAEHAASHNSTAQR